MDGSEGRQSPEKGSAKEPGKVVARSRTKRSEEILDASAELFLQKGYAATRTRDIAERVGILNGSLFHHFDSKETLLYEVLLQTHELMTDHLEQHRRVKGRPIERLRKFLETHTRLVAENLARSAVFHAEFRHLTGVRRDELLESRRRYSAHLRSLIDECAEAGEIDLRYPSDIVTRAILSLLNSLYLWYRPDGPLPPEGLSNLLGDLVLRGLAVRDEGSPHKVSGPIVARKREAR